MPYTRRHQDRQQQLINAIVDAGKDYGPLKGRRQWRLFINEYYRNLSPDDASVHDADYLAGAALCHVKSGRRLKDQQHHLRLYNPTDEKHGWTSAATIVEVVHRNMPFLVDSLGLALDKLGYSVMMTVHPLIRVQRTSAGSLKAILSRDNEAGNIESFIRFEIPKETRKERLKELKDALEDTLSDISAAVSDWRPMTQKMRRAIDDAKQKDNLSAELRDESVDLLEWLLDNNYTFLGYREYRLGKHKGEMVMRPVSGSALGITTRKHRAGRTQELTKAMHRFRRADDLILLTKISSRATVHRASYLDYVGIKLFDKDGNVSGERRFIGLLTSQAYNTPPDEIPLVRGKINEIVKRSLLDPTGHRGKALIHILNNYPRDELFQASVSDLLRTTTGILNLQDRRRVKFFVRRDTFRRFYSCLIFIPREKYNTEVRQRTEHILREHLGATHIESSVQMSDSTLARVHMLAYAPSDKKRRVSIRAIEKAINTAVITWRDRLRDTLVSEKGLATGADLYEEYGRAFPLAYEEDMPAEQACRDIEQIHAMLSGNAEPLSDHQLLIQKDSEGNSNVCFRVFRNGDAIPLSDALPLLENMGVRVVSERPYHLKIQDQRFWIQDFELNVADQALLRNLNKNQDQFAAGFAQQLSGIIESDGYNRLIVAAELDTRAVALLRAYAKYLLQLGLPFSQNYLEEMLCTHADFSRSVYRWFVAAFDPAAKTSRRHLTRRREQVEQEIAQANNLDADRALRAIFSAMTATMRCNFFWQDEQQQWADAIAFKIETDRVEEAPLPRPAHEIFVYSTRVEGVHLRAGDVARGGLRWSDRREDFRTEVLGLMKAQTVKNTVIVPTGAKGGFYPKQLPTTGRDEIFREVTACYKIFIGALLSVTDNLVNGEIVPPAQIVVRDKADPYLVVAADKGTATFSDTANEIAVARDFWLGDAFASGGSAGYDHKKMAITARGAWEAVKRHFRESGVDTQTDLFSVVGIGDMSGDVFGNGMLLSETIQLKVAFNHLHIFLDPTPDAATGFAERKRLFNMPRSGWDDYNTDLISAGGGVFSRNSKSIPLSAPVQKMLGVTVDALSPPELIRCALKMPSDLLWNGGIGTYAKASNESDADVGDRSNDQVRVNAAELGCKVIGEGGNLGFTQRARIEFARHGGRVNTDFIDNSAGVDSSDREVNIKILMRDIMQSARMSMNKRNDLLAEMTDEVAQQVLRNNYLQTQALSMMEANASDRLSEYREVVNALERSGLLNRSLEAIPDDEALAERKLTNEGLTRPELSVVLSYAKLDLYQRLSAAPAELTDRDHAELRAYFPKPLRKRFRQAIESHQLGGDITRTLLTNSIVNRMGPSFVIRASQDTGYPIPVIADSYIVARDVMSARKIWQDIEALDNRIPANIQYEMMFAVARKMRHACYWLLRTHDGDLDCDALIQSFGKPLRSVFDNLTETLSAPRAAHLKKLSQRHESMGVPSKLAYQVSALSFVNDALEIVRIAELRQCDVSIIAKVYFAIGERLRLDWVRQSIDNLSADGRWQARARGTLRDNIIRAQRELTVRVHSLNQCRASERSVDDMLKRDPQAFERTDQLISQMKDKDQTDFATLTVAVDELTKLIQD
ncbi:MAG: NAD-glutamate dehydrogenase [Woeseiaceae bacterium]